MAMHRQVASLVSTKSPGRLAKLGSALGARGINIATTGGAEWKHHGPVTLMIQDDWGAEPHNDLGSFADVMAEEGFPWLVFRTIEVELADEPGALGGAAAALGDVNIYAVTVLEAPAGRALVGLGVRPSQVGEAIFRLRDAGYIARRRHHPEDPDHPDADTGDDWWDEWDERTERLIGLFDDPAVPADDRRFYERSPSQAS
jgi:hypothetical protein